MESRDIVVVGGGVLGLATAAELKTRGHDVAVVDPGGPNASAVAAGMIAPALEAAVEDAAPAHAALLRAARDLWPDFAARTGVTLDRTGSEWRGAGVERIAERLSRLGFEARVSADRVETADDWQVDPEAALAALRAGLTIIAASVEAAVHDGAVWRLSTGAGELMAKVLVLATGAAPALPGLPQRTHALVEAITPIRGQIGRLAGRGVAHALRTEGAYLAPSSAGLVLGATMETGRRDLSIDPQASARMESAARAAFPEMSLTGVIEWRAAVRGATADGLPLAGPSGDPALHLALAPRRNGWLLAPLVASVVADGVEGRAPGQLAPALDPRRFG